MVSTYFLDGKDRYSLRTSIQFEPASHLRSCHNCVSFYTIWPEASKTTPCRTVTNLDPIRQVTLSAGRNITYIGCGGCG